MAAFGPPFFFAAPGGAHSLIEMAVSTGPLRKTQRVSSAPEVDEITRLDDEVCRENLNRDDEVDLAVQGRVVSCRVDPHGKYLFYFDNGQIWKQKDNIPIRWKDCSFEVTIGKDFFGYKMVADGEKRKIRIARVQ